MTPRFGLEPEVDIILTVRVLVRVPEDEPHGPRKRVCRTLEQYCTERTVSHFPDPVDWTSTDRVWSSSWRACQALHRHACSSRRVSLFQLVVLSARFACCLHASEQIVAWPLHSEKNPKAFSFPLPSFWIWVWVCLEQFLLTGFRHVNTSDMSGIFCCSFSVSSRNSPQLSLS